MTWFDRRFRSPVVITLLLLARTDFAAAQSPVIDGPPAPVAPEVITRRADGQVSVRAIKLSAPLKVDGVLDEEVYSREGPFGD
jgi:hypothetical protein